jgi:ribonuclease HI
MNSIHSIRTFLIPEENMKSKKNNQKNELEKMNDPNFIFNPNSKRFIKATSSVAKRILDSYTIDQLKKLALEHQSNPTPKSIKKSLSIYDDSSDDINGDSKSGNQKNKKTKNDNISTVQIYKINCIDKDNDIVNKVDQFTSDFNNNPDETKHQNAVNLDIKTNMIRDGASISESTKSIGSTKSIRTDDTGSSRSNGSSNGSKSSRLSGGTESLDRKSLDNRNLYTIDIGKKILEQRRLKEIERKNLIQRLNSNLNSSSSASPSVIPIGPPSVIMKDLEKRIVNIYTDGAVSNNGRSNSSGGIGVYFGPGHDNNLSQKFKEYPVTNQRAEVWAIVKALEILINSESNLDTQIKIVIYTDSTYAMNVITKTWKAKDNLDLISKAWKLLAQFNNLEIKYIRAHSNKKDIHSIGNDMADRLAVNGKDL